MEECKIDFVAVAVACKVGRVGQLNEITMHADKWRENLEWLMADGNEGATCLAVRVQVLSSLVKFAWEAADCELIGAGRLITVWEATVSPATRFGAHRALTRLRKIV